MRKNEECCVGIRDEGVHIGDPGSEQRLDFGRPAIAQPHPDHVRRRASKEAPLSEVIVLRDDHVTTCCRELPDGLVIGTGQPEFAHVRGVGEEIRKAADQAAGEILVEEETRRARATHAAVSPRSRRSRSAAKAKAARMSSRSRSGKSARISSSLIPPAR